MMRKMIRLAKFAIFGVAISVKICLLIKSVNTLLKFKYLLVTVGYLVLHAIKLWLSSKEHTHTPTILYHTDATHEHHLNHGDDDWTGESWKRKLAVADHDNDAAGEGFASHKLAYALHRPERANPFWENY